MGRLRFIGSSDIVFPIVIRMCVNQKITRWVMKRTFSERKVEDDTWKYTAKLVTNSLSGITRFPIFFSEGGPTRFDPDRF